jgi:hypothetical protein
MTPRSINSVPGIAPRRSSAIRPGMPDAVKTPNEMLRMSWKSFRNGSGDWVESRLSYPLCRSSIRGHSEIMFRMLVVVLGRNPIARLEFSLG